jgi:hypothetical protein
VEAKSTIKILFTSGVGSHRGNVCGRTVVLACLPTSLLRRGAAEHELAPTVTHDERDVGRKGGRLPRGNRQHDLSSWSVLHQ